MYGYAGAQTECKWHGINFFFFVTFRIVRIRCGFDVAHRDISPSTPRIKAAKLLNFFFFLVSYHSAQCTITHALEKVFPTLESVSICVAWHLFGAEFSLDSLLFFFVASHLLFIVYVRSLMRYPSTMQCAPHISHTHHFCNNIVRMNCILIDLIYNEAYDFLSSVYKIATEKKNFFFSLSDIFLGRSEARIIFFRFSFQSSSLWGGGVELRAPQ